MKKYLLLLALVCLLGNRGLAQEYRYLGAIDFTGLNFDSHWQLAGVESSNNTLVSVSEQNRSFVIDENNRHISVKLDDTANGWSIWKSDATNSTYLQKYDSNARSLFIDGLKQGDKIKIYTEGGVYNNNLRYYEIYSNNTDVSQNDNYVFECWKNTSQDIKIVNNNNNGTVNIRLYAQYAGIHKIEVWENIDQQTDQGNKNFDYDPGYEEYDMYDEFSYKATTVNGSNGQPYTSYSPSAAGFSLNGQSAQFITLSNSKITANNRIAFDQSGQWRFNFGIRPPNDNNQTWSNFSICNLREGDRVVLSYTGETPIFSSIGGEDPLSNPTYNGCMAFADKYNDGVFNDGDVYITPGAAVIEDWRRGEGAIYKEDQENINNNNNQQLRGDAQLIYTRTYTITEDGHLDLAIKNAPGTRIVKFKIYSDHQAMMVDRPESEPFTNTSYFNITGELQAKEHIVPGGLEVHVGSDAASQHAHVVSSQNGPVAIVNAVDGFKLPGMSGSVGNLQFIFDLANNLPQTGTFYKFVPLESGNMTVKFQAASMNYYRYDLRGDAVYFNNDGWTEQFDRPNEQTVNEQCPYYVKVSANNNVSDAQNVNWIQGGTTINNGDYGVFKLHVEAGKTYYLYGGWNTSVSGTSDLEYIPFKNSANEHKACGVAKLFEVTFEADKGIYPLAKWVPNGTQAVKDYNGVRVGVPNPDTFEPEYELATVKGYDDDDITIKKVSGNIKIDDIHPFIYNGKLMIDGIDFIANKNKGGTILIKIGSPSVKSDPVYALTIAYSADPIYDDEQNELSEEDEQYEKIRGHVWDYSSNSLKGLTWNGGVGTAQPTDYGHYFADYFAADISNYSNKDEVLASLQKSGEGLLTQEMTNGNTDWMFNYNLVNASKLYDPVFTNKYDVDGDNADMIWDTEGTVIKTSSNQSCIFNEFKGADIHASANDPDRYVGIFEGGEFRIPWLMPNDRVIIWMGTGKGAFNDQAVFSIRNAYDALHNPIYCEYDEENKVWKYDEYIVGGSQWTIGGSYTGDGKNDYRGCYHFFATGHNGGPADMVFKMISGSMCKIYKIQIYRGDRIITNEIVDKTATDNQFLLYSTKADLNDTSSENYTDKTVHGWTLQYFGKEQKLANGSGKNSQENEIIAKTGDIRSEITTNATDNTFTYSHELGEIGTFRMRGKDMEKNMNYVADYADHNVTIAYQETMKYPYTWDFMDMTGYKGNPNANIKGNVERLFEPEEAIGDNMPDDFKNIINVVGINNPSETDAENVWKTVSTYQKTARDLSLWEVNSTEGFYFLRLNSQTVTKGTTNPRDNIFETAKSIDGNQVWANGEVIPETQGLWFYTENNTQYTDPKWIISDNGMALNGNNHTLTVPNVPVGAAVYLRMEKLKDDASYTFKLKDKNGEAQQSEYLVYANPVEKHPDELILAVKNNSSTKKHLIISVKDYQLKKLGVSLDPKSVNTKGYASESRIRDIDAALTSYLTGIPIKTYFAGQPNYGNRTLVLTDISKSANNHVMPANTGCVLYNSSTITSTSTGSETNTESSTSSEDRRVKIFEETVDGKDNYFFHLFVPDMHDQDKLADPNETVTNEFGPQKVNMMKPQLTKQQTMHQTETVDNIEYTVYVLSYKFYKLDAEGNTTSNAIDGPEMFYRIATDKPVGLKANSAYLLLPTSEVKPQGANGAKYSFLFADWDDLIFDEVGGIATAVEGIEETSTPVQYGNEGWYTINGQKLSGRPTTSGLYIVNGKKVLVK